MGANNDQFRQISEGQSYCWLSHDNFIHFNLLAFNG